MAQGLTIETSLPGVLALVNTQQVARPVQRQPSSTFFAVGYSPWGPVNVPTVVTSWMDYVSTFGPFDPNSFLDDAAYVFFNVFPGKQMVVCRVVGAGATKGTVTLLDRAGVPIATLKIDQRHPSSRADIRYTVEDGSEVNTFRLTLRSVLLNAKEIHDNLKMDAASLARVNQDSRLVTLTNMNSATAAPANRPANVAETLLPAGNDDFAALTAADYIGTDNGSTRTGLQAFKDEQEFGGGQVAIPGLTTTAVHAALVAHADAFHRLALLDPPLASDKAAVAAIRALYGTWYGAIYWPWVDMLSFDGDGLRKFYPPSSFAAGACAKADSKFGTHRAPAGEDFVIPGALGVERTSSGQTQTDDPTREYLNFRDVNVIAPFKNQGVLIYGARVMTGDRRVQMVHEARMLNLFYYSARLAYRWAVFQVVDGGGRLFRDLAATGRNFLRSFWEDGALYGRKEQEAFSVKCDSGNNPASEVDAGRIRVAWTVKFSPTAEVIIVPINNLRLFQDLGALGE